MMTNTFVALLRGINVGGNAKVEMPKLKKSFEELNCKNVSTYINSGNVIFRDNRSSKDLVPKIEAAILKDFGLDVPVVIRDLNNVQKLVKAVPLKWTNDDKQKTDVLFLWPEIDNKDILKKVIINPKIENVIYKDGALVWSIGRENISRGGGIKLIKSDLYKYMTVRNINTLRKLEQLMLLTDK